MEFSIIPESKFQEILIFLRNNFADEPLDESVGLCKPGEECPPMEKKELLTLREGLSVMAVDTETKELAGVGLNGLVRPGHVERAIEETKKVDNIPFQRVFELLHSVNQSIDLFHKYGVDKIFELRILSINPKYRGIGLGKQIYWQCEDVARKAGFKLIKVDATSYFSQRILTSVGFTIEKSVAFEDYKDETGKTIYNTKYPHINYMLMTKMLPP